MMRFLRWLAVALGVLVVGVAGVVFLLGDRGRTALAVAAAHAFIDTHEFEGDFEGRWGRQLEITVRNLHLSSNDETLVADVEFASAAIDLPAMLDGVMLVDRLKVQGAFVVFVSATESGDRAHPVFDPVLKMGELEDFRLRYFDPEGVPKDYYLETLSVTSRENGLLHGTGRGAIDVSAFSIDAQIGELRAIFDPPADGYPIQGALGFDLYAVHLDGKVADPWQFAGFDFDVHVEAPTVNPFLNMQLPGGRNIGRVDLRARAVGDVERLALEHLDIDVRNDQGLSIDVDGRIGDVYTMEGVDVALNALIDDIEVLGLVEQFDTADHLLLAGRVAGDANTLSLRGGGVELTTVNGDEINLTGRMDVDLTEAGTRVDFSLVGNIRQQQRFQRGHPLFELIFELEKLDLDLTVTVTEFDLGVVSLRLDAGSEELGSFVLRGHLGSLPFDEDQPFRDAGLDIRFESKDASDIGDLFGIQLGPLKQVTASARLVGDGNRASVENFSFTAFDPNVGRGSLNGELTVDFGADLPLVDLQIDVDGRIDSLATFGDELDIELIDPGPIDFLGRVRGARDRIDIEALDATFSSLEGRVDAGGVVTLRDETLVVDLPASVRFDDLAALLALWDVQATEPLGGVKGRATIAGAGDVLRLEDIEFASLRSDPVSFFAKGRIGAIPMDAWSPSGFGLDLQVATPAIERLGNAFGVDLPPLGKSSVTARLTDERDSLDLDPVRLVIGDEKNVLLEASGVIRDVGAPGGVSWSGHLKLEPDNLINRWIGTSLPDLGTMDGSFALSDVDGTLGLESVDLELYHPDAVQLRAKGSFDNLAEGTGIDIAFDARDSLDAGDLVLSGRLTGRHDDAEIAAELKAGESIVSARSQVRTTGERPAILLDVHAPLVNYEELAAIVLEFGGVEQEAEGEIDEKDANPRELFSTQPLDFSSLDVLDLDLSMVVDEFRDEFLRRFSGHLTVADGDLSLAPVRVDYADGQFEGRLRLDRSPGSAFTLRLLGRNVLLESWLAPVMDNVAGTMTLDLDLSASGESVAEVASQLNGTARVLIEDGYLPMTLVDLLAVDLFDWAVNSALASERRQKVSCAIGKLVANDGRIDVDTLVLQGPGLDLSGSGWVDFADQTLDVVVVPRRKNLAWSNAGPVGLSGSLTDPALEANLGGIAVKEVASYTLLGYFYLPFLWITYLFSDPGERDVRCLYDTSEFNALKVSGHIPDG